MIKKIGYYVTGIGVLAVVFWSGVGAALSNDNPAQKTTTLQQMEIIWSESDGQNQAIYTSSFRDGSWAAPTKLTDGQAANLHPTIDVDQKQRKWAAWTAINGRRFVIKYSSATDDQWQSPKDLPSTLQTNIKPAIAVDATDTPWLVWSGNNGGNDDIYYAKYQEGSWTTPKRVHELNRVPDVLPFLTINQSGNPEVSWDGFRGQEYVRLKSSWTGSSWSSPVTVAQADSTSSADQASAQAADEQPQVTIPAFIKDTRQVYLRAYTPNPNQDTARP